MSAKTTCITSTRITARPLLASLLRRAAGLRHSRPKKSMARMFALCMPRRSALVERARRGEGPAFLLCNTYRYHGHHVGDIQRAYYRSKEEEEYWKTERDPIKLLGAVAELNRGIADADALDADRTARYRPRSRRVSHLRSTRPSRHQRGRARCLCLALRQTSKIGRGT